MFARSVASAATVVLFAAIMITLIGPVAFIAVGTTIPPRTPWGHSDLQGIWTTETLTPLERPAGLANKAVLTAEEAAELERRTDASRADVPPREGDPGTYNRFWSEASPDDADSGTGVRVWLSRGELQHSQHAQRGTRARHRNQVAIKARLRPFARQRVPTGEQSWDVTFRIGGAAQI
jgi:hypothetical protein